MQSQVIVALTLALSITVAFTKAGAQSPAERESASNRASLAETSELRKKAEAGDSSAAYELGHAYETGKNVPKDLSRAAFWYRKAAEQGNPKAQGSLGILYWLGDGVDKDKKEAIQWYHKAARQSDATAMFNLGAAYYDGEGVPVDDSLAYAWFVLSSEAGSEAGLTAAQRSATEHGPGALNDACVAIGEMYEKGVDLPLNSQLAADWYRKAAQGAKGPGRTEGAIRLASLFLKAANYSAARPWCEAVANDGQPKGAFCLGNLYQKGLGVDQDLKAALRWYEQAAKGGHIPAMYALGQMHENGQGTRVDRVVAMVWLIDAANHGNKDAVAEALKVRASMTDQEWKDAEKKLRERGFDPKKVDSILRDSVREVR